MKASGNYFKVARTQYSWSDLGIIDLVRTQNFPKNKHFLPPDMYMYVCVSGGKNG